MDNWTVTVHKTEYKCRTVKQVMAILAVFKDAEVSNWQIGVIKYA